MKNNNKNNNNNNLENENDIDDSELEKKSLKSIKEIAQSYSISTTNLKKAEIIEKIKSIVKRKREYEEEQEQKENVNSFNKIIKLTITDNIEPTEILFWKLFRNKAIYKKIFSFMDNQFTISYDSIDDICKLVNSNQVNLIREKVYRNCRYLHFHPNQYHNHIADIHFLVKLFSTIKEDDYRFYRNFFNEENDYFSSPNHITQASIISKRLQVFKLFVNEFNYEPTKKDLLYSIISGSNKFIKYILELNSPNSVLFDRKIVDTDFKDFYAKGFGSNYPTKEDSFFKGFLCFLNNINLDENDRDQYYKLLIGQSIHNPYSGYGFQINEKSTLKSLITTARLILKLKTPSASYKVQFKEECFPKVLKKIEAVATIEEIDNFIKKIDKVNLKSFLDDPINFNNSDDNNEIKNFIKKLLKLYYLNFSIELSNTLYFCYYHEDSNDDYKVFHFHHLIETAFRFGNYEILESYETINCLHFLPGIGQDHSNQNHDSHRYKVLFSHCFNKGKKIKFIDHIIQRTIQQPEPGFQIYFLYMLVIHNNIELVKYYSNKVGKNIQVESIGRLTPPTYYIESIEMLEYLFYNQCNYFRDVFFDGKKSTFYKNLELLKHFESLLNKSKLGCGSGNCSGMHSYNGLVSFIKGMGFGSGIYGSFEYKSNKNYVDFAKHFASNPQIYKGYTFDYEHLFLLFTTPVSSSSSFSSKISINFETLRNLLINAYSFGRSPIFERSKPTHTQHHYSREYLKFFDWMCINYSHEIGDRSCRFLYTNEERYKYHLLIAVDRIDLDKDNYYNGGNDQEEGNISVYIERLNSLTYDVIYFTPYLYEINNFKFLNWFLTIIEKYHNSKSTSSHDKSIMESMVFTFMEYITLHSKLQILEYIHHNFHFILKKQSDGGILNIGELKSFIFSSLKRDSIKISKFLFQFITITKNEFGKYSNEKTKSYFKNMFK
ncbi:hypothetical protein DDB_G0271438 [Dictyostelium discoideum AX4]|uniref:Rho termination factor-like N-terminal domain-containing protein n=1 Tax=Dictyostelium discoideum TaxID=44689 RepID=Q55B42_DICDI|nr:hypothetical protein DDB_G0271438 [Dictyostelium discoideum AX4]EAL71849.1 hypothetical protein DDB_G0271438 [Dictyostelium discoideum AX4]|eukprot:XP_645770.1 hypothetical protein DDB_G0271438 [Dictyostelium discoideum AX4]